LRIDLFFGNFAELFYRENIYLKFVDVKSIIVNVTYKKEGNLVASIFTPTKTISNLFQADETRSNVPHVACIYRIGYVYFV
jgi:hypothetical protein